MRSSQLFGTNNTLFTFTNTGFRTIQPGDNVLLGFDGNVSAPTYRASFPNTNTASAIPFTKNNNSQGCVAGYGRAEFPSNVNSYRDFVYDAETDSLYGFLDGTGQAYGNWNQVQFTRISRTNGFLNNTVFVTTASSIAAYQSWSYGGGSVTPSLPVKMYDNGGTNDVWMITGGGAGTVQWITLNGSTGATMSMTSAVSALAGGAVSVPFVKISNGYGVFAAGQTTAGSLVAFSVNAAGTTVTLGALQTPTMLGITAGGSTLNDDLIPLGNTGAFLYFRQDIGTYGTIYVVTLNTSTLALTVVNSYALTAAQANYAGRDGTGWIFSALNASNQIVFYQRNSTTAGALTLLTYTPSTKSLVIGNAVPILSASGQFVTMPTPLGVRLTLGAHSTYDGYNFYFAETNCNMKIPFNGTAVFPNGIVAYTKNYTIMGSSNTANSNGYGQYAVNQNANGIVYQPMFYTTLAASFSNNTAYPPEGYWTTAEESLDNTFAYGVEIGIATTSAAKGASVTVAVSNTKLSAVIGTPGTVGAMSANGASIYVSPTQLFKIEEFDLVQPRLPAGLNTYAPLNNAAITMGDNTLLVNNAPAPSYQQPAAYFGAANNGMQTQTATKIENFRKSMFLLMRPNWYIYTYAPASGSTVAPILLSFDGIFLATPVWYCNTAGSNYVGAFEQIYNTVNLSTTSRWSFRNEFGFCKYDYLYANNFSFRYQTKD